MNSERTREERAAFARLHAGDPGARAEIAERHLPLVRHLARRYAGGNESQEDLEQVGAIGLLNAIDRYDPASGNAFSTFAVPTILGEIRRHFRDRTWPVRVPRSLRTSHSRAATPPPSSSAARDACPRPPSWRTRSASTSSGCWTRGGGGLPAPASLDRVVRTATTTPGRCTDRAAEDDALGRADAAFARAPASRLGARDREILRLRFEEDLTQPRSPRASASPRCTSPGCCAMRSTSSRQPPRAIYQARA